jgi:hemolysin activation/secretion protein
LHAYFVESVLNNKKYQCFRISILISAALFLMLTSSAFAQVVPAQSVILSPAESAVESMRRQEERTRVQQQLLLPKADVLQAARADIGDTELPVEFPCFLIKQITVGQNNAGKFSSLNSKTVPFLNRCIGVQGLRKVASVLDAKLLEMGYVTTRVSLAEQNLSGGKLVFFLHEGRIADIMMTKAGVVDNTPDETWGSWRNAFPMERGDILNIRDLEQGVEQMKRLPSQSVSTKIEPGQEPDTSIVRIERQTGGFKDRVRGSATLDNSGSEALGRGQVSASLSLDNLLGFNDILSISSNINAQQPNSHHRSYGLSTSYNIPWGYHSFNVSANTNRFAQYVQGTTARFLSSGSSETAELKWNYITWRTASAKAGVFAGLSTRRAESFLDDVELLVQRRRTSTIEAGVTYKQFVGDGSVDFDISYRKGSTLGKAQEDFPSAASGGLTIRPRIWSFSSSINQAFLFAGKPLQYSTSVRGQFTHDTTLSIDQISIGGRGSVRGFDGDSVLLAESGVVVRNELSSALPTLSGIDSSAFVALDFGKVSGASVVNLVGTRLAGFAVGTRGRWQGFLFDLSIGTPIYKPGKFHTRRFNPYLSITYLM